VLKPLRSEGLSDVELIGVYTNGRSWSDRNDSFDAVTFPMLLDPEGGIFWLYNTTSYDMIFIDKQLRLVSKQAYDDSLTGVIKQRLRELHAE
jgi:hypothetical protein